MSYILKYEQLDKVLEELKEQYKIYAPVRLKGIGRFSDTDVIRYGEINSSRDIIWAEKSDFSPKEIIFPITQTLFYFLEDKVIEPKVDEKGIIIFLRPCDINGITRLDQVFMNNGREKDVYYERLRKKVKFFMIECATGFDSCFCVSMDTNKTDMYDVAVRFEEDGVLCNIKDKNLEEHFCRYDENIEFEPQFVSENITKVALPDTEKITLELFEHPMWKEYSSRCIACGRCNFVCTTCSCWTMQDIIHEDNDNAKERRRVWAGCHVDGFTDMAGGHGFRKNYGDRMRFKTLHKIYDFKKRNGVHMCIGCGRCDDVCPEYISFSNCINKVTKLVEEVKKDE